MRLDITFHANDKFLPHLLYEGCMEVTVTDDIAARLLAGETIPMFTVAIDNLILLRGLINPRITDIRETQDKTILTARRDTSTD